MDNGHWQYPEEINTEQDLLTSVDGMRQSEMGADQSPTEAPQQEQVTENPQAPA